MRDQPLPLNDPLYINYDFITTIPECILATDGEQGLKDLYSGDLLVRDSEVTGIIQPQ
jgi:hypothetical protein